MIRRNTRCTAGRIRRFQAAGRCCTIDRCWFITAGRIRRFQAAGTAGRCCTIDRCG